ncbi:MAG: hypothetical protein LBQ46_14025 [Treponema sp.]|nr:hypothetical protein [Treponema sp.]
MKKRYNIFLGFAVLLMAAIFTLAGCGNKDTGDTTSPPGGDGPEPQTVTYTSTDSAGNRYSLAITEDRARSALYAAQTGDSFALTVELFNNGQYSVKLTYSGTVGPTNSSGTSMTLQLSISGNQINITIVGTTMTIINGTIPLDESAVVEGTIPPEAGTELEVPDGGNLTPGGGTRETALPLIDGVWADGSLTAAMQECWYKLEVPASEFYTQYNVWWKDNNVESSGTMDVKVSSFRGTSTTATDANVDNGWASAGMRVYQYSGTVYFKVEPYHSNGGPGTYSIVATSVLARPGPVNGKTAYSVTADGSAASPTTALTFTFDQAVPTLNATYLSLADAASLDGAIFTASSGNTVWTVSGITVKYTGRAYAAVTAANVDPAGHMVKVYGSGTNAANDGSTRETAIPLTDNEWADGYLHAGGEKWYQFNAAEFYTQYNVWWKDNNVESSGTMDVKVSGFRGTSATAADANKDHGWNSAGMRVYQYSGTAYFKVEPYHSNGGPGTYSLVATSVLARPGPVNEKTAYSVTANGSAASPTTALTFTFDQAVNTLNATYLSLADAASLDGATFTASSGNTVWTVSGITVKYTGRAYAAVTATNVDPAGHMVKVYGSGTGAANDGSTRETAIPLSASQWADGYLHAGGEKWYKIDATGGSSFNVWWLDNGAENSGTMDVVVSSYLDSSGSAADANKDNGWTNAGITVTKSSGTIYLKVEPYSGRGPGTYAIAYSTTATRP